MASNEEFCGGMGVFSINKKIINSWVNLDLKISSFRDVEFKTSDIRFGARMSSGGAFVFYPISYKDASELCLLYEHKKRKIKDFLSVQKGTINECLKDPKTIFVKKTMPVSAERSIELEIRICKLQGTYDGLVIMRDDDKILYIPVGIYEISSFFGVLDGFVKNYFSLLIWASERAFPGNSDGITTMVGAVSGIISCVSRIEGKLAEMTESIKTAAIPVGMHPTGGFSDPSIMPYNGGREEKKSDGGVASILGDFESLSSEFLDDEIRSSEVCVGKSSQKDVVETVTKDDDIFTDEDVKYEESGKKTFEFLRTLGVVGPGALFGSFFGSDIDVNKVLSSFVEPESQIFDAAIKEFNSPEYRGKILEFDGIPKMSVSRDLWEEVYLFRMMFRVLLDVFDFGGDEEKKDNMYKFYRILGIVLSCFQGYVVLEEDIPDFCEKWNHVIGSAMPQTDPFEVSKIVGYLESSIFKYLLSKYGVGPRIYYSALRRVGKEYSKIGHVLIQELVEGNGCKNLDLLISIYLYFIAKNVDIEKFEDVIKKYKEDVYDTVQKLYIAVSVELR